MKTRLSLAACAAVFASVAFANGEVPLWPAGRMPDPQPNQKYAPYLNWFEPSNRTTTAVAILVSGGGYNGCGVNGFEVVPMRDFLLSKGMTVVTMRYRTPRPKNLAKHAIAWQDAQRTVRIVRSEAKKRGLDPENIGFSGCSAGGHLTLMTALSSQTPAYAPVDELDTLPCHINWAIPVYPAYVLADAMEKPNDNCGNDLSAGLAPEFKFDAATPPMCFFHGDADGWTSMGSVRVYHKLRTMGIPAELHVMALSKHCFMSNPRPDTFAADWKNTAWNWLVSLDIVTGHPQTWRSGWRTLIAPDGASLSEVADYDRKVWKASEWGKAVVTASKDDALWLKGEYENFILDFEYKLDTAAKSGVIIYAGDRKNRNANSVAIQLPTDSAEKWNRATIWAFGSKIRVKVNGKVTVEDDRVRSATRGSIGFQGMHDGARPYFRNMHILEAKCKQ